MADVHYIQLRAISARNLIAADSNGFSDPYLIISSGKEKRKTKVIKKSLNPEWNQQFQIPVRLSDTIKIKAWDKDRFSRDDPLGETQIQLSGIPLVQNEELVKWYKLLKVKSGEIQIGIKALTFGRTASSSNLPPLASSSMPSLNQPQQANTQVNQAYPTQPYPNQPYPSQMTASSQGYPQQGYPQQGYPQQGYSQPDNPPSYLSGANNMTSSAPNPAPNVPAYLRGSVDGVSNSSPQSPTMRYDSQAKNSVSDSASREGYDIEYNEIVFGKKIGVGAFGEVWKGEWAGTTVAIKKILKTDISENDLEEFSTEILLMSKLRHPNIVQFLGACIDPEFCLLTEFMDKGVLFDVVQQNQLGWKMKANMCLDIAKGMTYLHTRKPPIIHRDIKSLNILVTKDWKCTITDFGLTKIKNKAMLSTRCGSPAWSAPEVLRGEQYDEKADVFSFAIVMWEIIAQQPPYKGLNPNQVIGQVAYQKPGMRPQIPHCPDNRLLDVMIRNWDDNPNVRATFPEILESLKQIHQTIQD